MKSKLETCRKIKTLVHLFNFINDRTLIKVIFVDNKHHIIEYEEIPSLSL